MTWHTQWGNGGNWAPYGTYPFDKVVSHQTPKFPKNGKTLPMESAGGAAVQLEITTTSLIQISSKSGKKIKYCRYWATNTNSTDIRQHIQNSKSVTSQLTARLFSPQQKHMCDTQSDQMTESESVCLSQGCVVDVKDASAPTSSGPLSLFPVF